MTYVKKVDIKHKLFRKWYTEYLYYKILIMHYKMLNINEHTRSCKICTQNITNVHRIIKC